MIGFPAKSIAGNWEIIIGGGIQRKQRGGWL